RPLGELLPQHSALDGEIVIARNGVLDFDSMQMRPHPAESRVRKLSAEIPAEFVVFDVLLWDSEPVHQEPLEDRRVELEKVGNGFRLSPTTTEADRAQEWLSSFEAAGLDGVIAKRLGVPYLPGSREAVLKVKPYKTADCVIVGLRWKEKPTRIATLLLGLYDDDGKMDYVGSAAVAASRHAQIAERVLPLLKGAPERGFSEPNRWGTGELEERTLAFHQHDLDVRSPGRDRTDTHRRRGRRQGGLGRCRLGGRRLGRRRSRRIEVAGLLGDRLGKLEPGDPAGVDQDLAEA